MKTAPLSQRDEFEFQREVETHPVGLFIGKDWLLTMSTTGIDVVGPSALKWSETGERFVNRGTGFLAYRDFTGGSRDIHLNAVSQSTNGVMKTLTVVATIFIPLTFVVGIYGVNFANTPFAMPELP